MDIRKQNNTISGFLRERLIPIIGALIVFITCFSVLYLGENVGLSDNGDFRRILLTNNLEYKNPDDHYYLFKQDYTMKLKKEDNFLYSLIDVTKSNEDEEIYSSPHFLIIKISKVLNLISNALTGKELTEYNIAYLALLYIFMLSLAAWVIFTFFSDASLKIRLAVFVMFIFIFCDAGYLLYFNSFYGEPLQYTALMMLIAFGMLIYKRPTVPKAIGFFVSLYFFAGAKLANIPYSLIAAALAIAMVIMRKDFRFKAGVILSALISIICIASLYTSIPDWMDRDTTYQAVFLGITKNSETAAEDLTELGVSEKYAALAGTHAYMDEDEYPIDIRTEEFEKDFYNKVSKFDIASFYLRHPIRLISELSHAIENSAYIRPPVVGNSKEIPMHLTEKFSIWSKIRTALRFLYSPFVIFTVFILITLYMIFMNIFYIHNHKIETAQRRYMIFSLDILIIGLWINLMLPILCNGEADIAKHMFLFTNCIDILFVVCIFGIITLPLKKQVSIITFMAIFTSLFYVRLPQKKIFFGQLNGKPLRWEISEKLDDGSLLLVTEDCVGYMPFDSYSNRWETSEIRKWLNTEFLSEFSAQEKDRILSTKNAIILPYSSRHEAVSGNHSHYWNFTQSLVDDMSSTAYHYYLEDYVFIPTLSMLEDIKITDSFWILCPYTANDNMMRFMNNDRFTLHTDIKSEKGVKAVIRIQPE